MKILQSIILLCCSFADTSQNYLSKKEALSEIEFTNQIIQEVHYNPYLYISEKTFLKKSEQIIASIPDSIEIKEFILILYRITSLIDDSHTSPSVVQPCLKKELLQPLFFPKKLAFHSFKTYLPESVSKVWNIPAGVELLSINGHSLPPHLKQFKTYIGGIDAFSHEMSERMFSYFLFLHNIQAPFKIKYKSSKGVNGELEINGVNFIESLSATMPHLKTPYSFRIIDNKLGYFNFMSMSVDLGELDAFADSCITLLKTKNIEHLAIDLRQNSGGNSILGDLLVSYFTTNKFSQMGKKQWKVSEAYKKYLVSGGDTSHLYLKQPVGTVWELGDCNDKELIFVNNNIFTGKLYLLTGAFTFSSANMLSDGIKSYKLATVIGEPTGENTNDFGETYVFELPISKIKIQTTTSFDFGVGCDKNKREPVKPDILITPTLHDKIYKNDPVLKYLIELVNK